MGKETNYTQMKKLTLLTTLMLCVIIAQAQTETLKEKLKRKLEEAKERKTEKTIDTLLFISSFTHTCATVFELVRPIQSL